jgi:hypothetical protein
MTDELKNLNIDSMLSKNDMDKLIELLGQNSVSLGGGNSKKKNKMTPQAKNFLLNQLSSHQKIQEVQKPLKDMNEQEKALYRQELKMRIQNKQNILKQNRTSHSVLKKSMDAKMKKTTEQETQETQEAQETQETQKEETLDDFV